MGGGGESEPWGLRFSPGGGGEPNNNAVRLVKIEIELKVLEDTT